MKNLTLGILAVLIGAAACYGQAPETSKYYKLEFVVKEVDGTRILNSRTYTTTAATETSGCSIRSGSKVPVQVSSGNSVQVEVGVSIDCSKLKEVEGELSLMVTAELTTIPQESAASPFPLIRQNKWNSTLVIPLRKPTVIFSSDDVTSKHQMQVELTAVPIK